MQQKQEIPENKLCIKMEQAREVLNTLADSY